jgi:hypothetical protein
MHNLNRRKNVSENVGYLCIFKKLPKVKNPPMATNSTNLVTLYVAKSTSLHTLKGLWLESGWRNLGK